MEKEQEKSIQDSKPAGYKVESILLIESSFIRNIDSKILAPLSNKIEILPSAHENTPDNKFGVMLHLKYVGLQNQEEVCSSSIKMIGVFEKYGEPALSDDKFKAINAPAIIYPFIREHLHNLCLKAGMMNVLLPTINFKP
jgi:preprotein translocase subunit SecB